MLGNHGANKVTAEYDPIIFNLFVETVDSVILTEFIITCIPERRIAATEYKGDLLDIKKIETTSAVLYEYAQGKQLAPVFPAGMILETTEGQVRTRIFFEVMAKKKDDLSIATILAGTFLCRQVDIPHHVALPDVDEGVYGTSKASKIIISNMLLDKYQLGTKKSEFQKRMIK